MHHHPNLSASAQAWANHPDQTLHVAAAYSNPCQWKTRRTLFNDFRGHMQSTANVKLWVGELAIGNMPFEVTGANEGDLQYRAQSILFHKENILNQVIQMWPKDWKYGAYIDGDFTFTSHGWAVQAIQELQHAPFVQLFSQYTNLSAKGKGGSRAASAGSRSFAATYIDNGHQLPPTAFPGGWDGRASSGAAAQVAAQGKPAWIPVGATGGAWAFTREAYETVGGLLDHCVLGHADWFMSFGLVSQPVRGTIAVSKYHPNYAAMITAWQNRAAALNKNIGVVDQFAVHHFHGALKNRGYETRDEILVKYQFDPIADLRRNASGIYELTDSKPDLRDAIKRYFYLRNEDDPAAI